jgi:hypothetical protein
MVAPREVLLNAEWCDELRFRERGELRRRGHRPDVVGCLPEGQQVPIEVELSEKSSARLTAVIGLHARWVLNRKSAAVIYVCGTHAIGERVVCVGEAAGLSVARGTLRVEPLARIKREAADACWQVKCTDWHLAGGEAR